MFAHHSHRIIDICKTNALQIDMEEPENGSRKVGELKALLEPQ